MHSKRAWSALLIAAATAGCGAAPGGEQAERVGTDALPISGGTLDMDDAAVFQEFTRYSDAVSACTASLIAPNLLLTARHCVSEGAGENVICGRTEFMAPVTGDNTVATNATAPNDKSIFYRGAEVRVPSSGSDLCGFDIALIILATPVPPSQASPLVPRIDRPVVPGEEYTAVGYGVNEGGERNPGRMQRGDLAVKCLASECAEFGLAPTEFMGETGVCSGDSGGPALDTEGKVIGVVSRGSDPCETPIYGQVSSWGSFLTQAAFDAAASGGYEPPFWAFSGSSDRDPTLTDAGDPCTDTSECSPGTVCYFDSDPSEAACRPVCQNDRQCGDGKECQSGFDVQGGGLCFDLPKPAANTPGSRPLPTHGADEKCSATRGRTGSTTSAWIVLALTAASSWRASKRRSRRA
jgi:trypsin